MDEIFKALADPTRRRLLDELFRQDRQTLGALAERFAMSRFGVMKHLAILEGAGLVATRKRGREKLHFLNAVPIRLIHDRWVGKYAEPVVAALGDLKTQLERPETTMEKIYEIYIRTTPEKLWEAITDRDIRAKFQFGARVYSDWRAGARWEARGGPAERTMVICEGEVVEADPPRKLVLTFAALWGDDVRAEGTSRVTWEIVQLRDSCRLVVTHDRLREGANEELFGGWPMMLSGLKTWLETGDVLTTPGSIRYA